jgi:hypothetical protein
LAGKVNPRNGRKLHPRFDEQLRRFAIVVVEKSSQNIPATYRALVWVLMDRLRNLLPQALMGASPVIVLAVFPQNVFCMAFIDKEQVIQTLLPYTAHPPLGIGVCVIDLTTKS